MRYDINFARGPGSLKEYFRLQSQNQPIELNSIAIEEIESDLGHIHFYKVKKQWKVGMRKFYTFLPDTKGLQRIYFLIQNAGQDLTCKEVYHCKRESAIITTSQPLDEASSNSSINESTHLVSNQEVLTKEAIQAYKKELSKLRQESESAREDGDDDKAKEIEDDIEAIEDQLKKFTYRGRSKKFESQDEKIRKAVSKSINEAIKLIGENQSVLGELFLKAIKTGYVCCYVPDERIGHVLQEREPNSSP